MGYEWERKFQSRILSRGWDYAISGMVSNINKNGESVTALVAGSDYYRVEIGFEGPMVREVYCSCPYAAEGNWCKHMVAVLYEIEEGVLDETNMPQIEEKKIDVTPSTIRELISSADRETLEDILLGLAADDSRVESSIRSSIHDRKTLTDIKKVEKEIDGIFKAFGGRNGYIDYYNASDFEKSLVALLKNQNAGFN